MSSDASHSESGAPAVPLLAFVTTVRHPLNSTDFALVEQMLRQSLTAWLRQTDERFVIIVVANESVAFAGGPRVDRVLVDFPPPSTEQTSRTGIAAVLRDKGTKNAIGLARARELGAKHVMFVDADDFVSRRLTEFVAADIGAPGWTITDGWRVQMSRRSVRRHRDDFHLQCGSSHIVRIDLLPATPFGLKASQEQLYASIGDRLERHLGSHMHLHDDLPLAPLPFPGALYRVGSGQSHSGNALGGWGRPITSHIADEFGVPSTPRSPRGIARAVLPSARALAERLPGLRAR
ncbi:hypothetical protein [Microbacterium sp. H1-D42]|uniref:hypothetical protein n=1 Tax=Microbacterium sp. H1-D42 TaxID=2925844 RepID=UPI001F52E575|nr:hypothetical protein [Microbacterium sp. H1-D42]UNK70149.1 hypothetical protein MNR00_13395 [Microbacterium sp. H1-D42]